MNSELSKFTDHDEKLLAKTLNKRELLNFSRQGLQIVVSWLRSSNSIEMNLLEGKHSREFPIPNDSVLDAAEHPEYYAALAGQPRPQRSPGGRQHETDGA